MTECKEMADKREFVITYSTIPQDDDKFEYIKSLPRKELLAFMNLGTHLLSCQTSLYKSISKGVTETKRLEIERECIKGDMPTTVALPTLTQRMLSVRYTALLYLIITRQVDLQYAKHMLSFMLSKCVQTGCLHNMMQYCYDNNRAKIESMLFVDTDYFVYSFFLLSMSDQTERRVLSLLWETYLALVAYKEPADAMICARNHVRAKSAPLCAGKNMDTINNIWLKEDDRYKGQYGTSIPALLLCKSAFTSGVNPTCIVKTGNGITKADITMAIDNTLYSQRAWNGDYIGQYNLDKALRADTDKACIAALYLRKFLMQSSKATLEQLSYIMYGDSDSQKKLDKNMAQNQSLAAECERLLALVRDKEKELEHERELRENAQKRANALKKRLEDLQRQADITHDASANDDQPADCPTKPVDSTTALREAGFELDTPAYKKVEKYSQQYKIIIAGGNENLMKRFKQKHQNITVIGDKQIGGCRELLQNADYLFLKVDCMSHSLYAKCKSIAQASGVPVSHMPDITSIAIIDKFIQTEIEKRYTAEEKEGGNGATV